MCRIWGCRVYEGGQDLGTKSQGKKVINDGKEGGGGRRFNVYQRESENSENKDTVYSSELACRLCVASYESKQYGLCLYVPSLLISLIDFSLLFM